MKNKKTQSRSSEKTVLLDDTGDSLKIIRFAFFISIAGLVDASYLSHLHWATSQTCIAGLGCTSVLASPYATVGGIPLAALGAGMYLALGWITSRILRLPEKLPDCLLWMVMITTTGVAASIYLTALQGFVIGEWCPFCLLSALLIALIFGISIHLAIRFQLFRQMGRFYDGLWREMPVIILALVLPACLTVITGMLNAAAVPKASAAPEQVVATIGGRPYTLEQVDRAIQSQLLHLDEERYAERKQYIESELLNYEAKTRGIPVKTLLQKEVLDSIVVDREEIRKFIAQNRSRLPKQLTPEFIKKIERSLRNQKIPPVRIAYLESLKKKYGLELLIPLPDRLNLDLPAGVYPESGPLDAPVTIVEFSDFECPYCSRTHRELKAVANRHPGRIRLIFRHFPLQQHQYARVAAEMSYCAQQQELFWPFADLVFNNQKKLSGDNLFTYAEDIGLDMDRFRECVVGDMAKKAVSRDIMDGKNWGLESTPSLFINGRFFSGLPDNLDEIIREEIARSEGK